jgi:4a-hydroxytetrahydrobiopterin dehydratase
MELVEKKCKPCEGGIPPMNGAEIDEYLKHINTGWKSENGEKLIREYLFVNFRHTMDFVNQVALVAEEEGHHPVLHVYYSKLIIELWTHAIKGLSENDFILAAKIDRLHAP